MNEKRESSPIHPSSCRLHPYSSRGGQMKRRLFNLLAAVSLMMFLGTAVLWERSYGRFGPWHLHDRDYYFLPGRFFYDDSPLPGNRIQPELNVLFPGFEYRYDPPKLSVHYAYLTL